MKAVILAAGRGTRMGDLTEEVPKPMLKVNGKTLLEYKLDVMPEEIDEVLIVVGYKNDVIRNHLGNQYKNILIKYIDMKELTGTGPALWLCKEYLNEKFLVLMGDDIYPKEDLENLIKSDWALLAYKREEGLQSDGVVEENGVFKGLTTEGSDLVCAGGYVLGPEIFNYELVQVPGKNEYGLPHTMVSAVSDFDIEVVISTRWFQITKPEDLKRAEELSRGLI